ncbi:MAG: transketolase family protein [Candidatus Omnitrophica bacterium]|nr:transketolase family protein [Candidatus Omnitrophota bacterium]
MAKEGWIPTRDGFGQGLVELGKKREDVVVLCADLTDSTRAGWFKKEFPDRFFSMGVAEQDMFGAAAGLALMGKTPFACTFGVFASGRGWDQIRISLAYMNLNVKVIGTHGGIGVGEDGATHQAIEEISLMRILPNMTVLVPADHIEARKATIAAASYPGPVYIRLGRNGVPVVTGEDAPFEIGKPSILADGKDVAIFACGYMVYESLLAKDILAKEGISAKVINIHTPKPLDRKLIIKTAKDIGAIVTVEEHLLAGGLGSAIAEVLVEEEPVPMKMVGIDDRFGESGDPNLLLDHFGLRAKNIAKAAKDVLKKKK